MWEIRNANIAKPILKTRKIYFLRISWEQYVRLTQNNHHSAKKRTANAKKRFQSCWRNVFDRILATVCQIEAKEPPKCTNKKCKCRKKCFKPAKICFCPYLGNSTSDWRKITTTVLKKKWQMLKNGFRAVEETFLIVSWQPYVRLRQKNHQSAQIRNANAVKSFLNRRRYVFARILATVRRTDAK